MATPEDRADDVVLLAVPRTVSRTLARLLKLGLVTESLKTGAYPTPEAARILHDLETAAHGRRSSEPATPPAAPATV
ncbi:hypothetical protein NGM37_04345, partial [Streptomyces sp. TRM76130]|nr:hypothetical protein [Streptomyces sp. TRM76130]